METRNGKIKMKTVKMSKYQKICRNKQTNKMKTKYIPNLHYNQKPKVENNKDRKWSIMEQNGA